MQNIQFTRKGEQEPIALGKLDEELCRVVEEPVHEKRWCCAWFDIVGYDLANGRRFDTILSGLKDDIESYPEDESFYRKLIKITEHLRDQFDIKIWSSWGRRQDG